ncbi:hypothetical protein PV08_07292 [Exophiala spinifera]|uniref:NmrA-like domain-containing protein n=1 Tax=Exophiala spinifera TaxID=91928 RepID=A0A0D2B6N1_9EURO|nr:uncharacterized protein PV08_07292 [Exophiala spinifera]KIW14508.1 hypothetical protein PV08_07292 [Exophiala spinifera]
MSQDNIFISGATGTQGSATVRALLRFSSPSAPIVIHALVRDCDSPQAQALSKLSPSVRLFKGHHDDPSSIATAAQSCTAAMFILMTGWTDPTAEQRHAQNILDVLSSIPTIKRVVYPTTAGVKDPRVAGAFRNIGEEGSLRYSYYLGKSTNERTVQQAAERNGWAWTIFKPATFLSNFLNPMANFMYPDLSKRKIVTVMSKEHETYFVDPEDIGRFSASALLGPGKGRNLPDLSSQVIDLASQVGTLEDVANAMNKALTKYGCDVQVSTEYVTVEEAERRGQNVVKIQNEQFQVDNPVVVDLDRVKSFGFELSTIDAYFEREIERLKEVLSL